MLESLKKQVYRANMMIKEYNLSIFTWGNVSGIDRKKGYIVIKPTGIKYDELYPIDFPIVDLEGNLIEGYLEPSSDIKTHIELYKAFPNIGGIAHTHSTYATSFSQAGRAIKPYGTTHADHFCSSVPCTRKMSPSEISEEYERNTGLVIAETFANIDPDRMQAVLAHSHGPFTWGDDAVSAVKTAIILESVAQMAFNTELLQVSVGPSGAVPMQADLLLKHFNKKHGKKTN